MNVVIEVDWSKIPEEYHWVGYDANGSVFAYSHEPVAGAFGWDMPVTETRKLKHIAESFGRCTNWRETLVRREAYRKTLQTEFPQFSNQDLDNVYSEWTPTHDRTKTPCPSYELSLANLATVTLLVGDALHRMPAGRYAISYRGHIVASANYKSELIHKMKWAVAKTLPDIESLENLDGCFFEELVEHFVLAVEHFGVKA